MRHPSLVARSGSLTGTLAILGLAGFLYPTLEANSQTTSPRLSEGRLIECVARFGSTLGLDMPNNAVGLHRDCLPARDPEASESTQTRFQFDVPEGECVAWISPHSWGSDEDVAVLVRETDGEIRGFLKGVRVFDVPVVPDVPNEKVLFHIQPCGTASAGSPHTYRLGAPIYIQCVWRNTGDRPYALFRTDDEQGLEQFGYPLGISAWVADSSGRPLCNTESGWWSSWALWSTLLPFPPRPEHLTSVQPGKEIVRDIPLDEVLRGGMPKDNRLKEGMYIVQLNLGPLKSNQLIIRLVD